MLEKYRHETRPEIRFVDVDAFGHVNNAHYLTYFEQARVKYFDDIVGWKYDWSKQGIILARAEINYVKPVHFRDVVVIRTRCTKIGNKSLELAYVMIAQHEGEAQLLAEGKTVMVAFDYTAGQSIAVPAVWKKALQEYEGLN